MTWKLKHPGRLAGAIGALLCMQLAAAQDVEELYRAGRERIQQAQAQQGQITDLADEIEDMFLEYQDLQRDIEDLQIYNNQLRAQVNQQRRELQQLYDAIANVGLIERQILPLMTRMISGLQRFVELDIPFLLDERLARVERLKRVLARSDVTVASQFNNVLSAWMIEMDDYGRTGEVYTDDIVTPDGITREVELLRIGRVTLVYRTPDGKQAGVWDRETRAWVTLDDSWLEDVGVGFEAYRTETPALFFVPVAPAEER